MNSNLEKRCGKVLEELGLCAADEISSVEPLTGGVASDIAAVSFGSKTVCVKFALEKLKVEADWFAPVHRSKAEYSWLAVAAQVAPTSTPKLFGWSEAENGFAMEFISGPGVYLWKTHLLSGGSDNGEAKAVADTLGLIHATSTRTSFDSSPFDNMDDFEQIRIDPYLRSTAKVHIDLEPHLRRIADQLAASKVALVHGDVSPKNILIRDGQPVILDAECATMGDPAFDVAFCLNHLILKSLHMPTSSNALLNAAVAFWKSYRTHVNWEPSVELEARVAELLPALFLARIDGKSPVEYLSETSRSEARQIARPLIERPVKTIEELVSLVAKGAVNA